MIQLLSFIFGRWVFIPFSWFVRMVLIVRGVKVGRNFYAEGIPYLKIRGKAKNIHIGSNVKFNGAIDIRNRENGQIVIRDGVSFDTNCRLVAANDAILLFREGADVGGYSIFNCGTDVTIGVNTMIANFCYIQSSSHGIAKDRPIKSQPHTYGKIDIGSDVWLGGHVTVLPGVSIGDGAVVGAKSVLTKSVNPFKIVAGVPASEIGER